MEIEKQNCHVSSRTPAQGTSATPASLEAAAPPQDLLDLFVAVLPHCMGASFLQDNFNEQIKQHYICWLAWLPLEAGPSPFKVACSFGAAIVTQWVAGH